MTVFWLEQSAADVPVHNDWLTASELARMNGILFPKRRADWRLGRWTAKCAAARSLGMYPDHRTIAGIEIATTPCGAPEVKIQNQPAPVSISISHRAGLGMCVVGPPGFSLGCDLEIVEQRSSVFVCDYFTPEEQQVLDKAAAADKWLLVSVLWSAKESALKVLREGLRLSTHSVVVTPFEVGHEPEEYKQNADWCASPAGLSRWHPLQVCCFGECIFRGWWQRSGDFVRTMVSHPDAPRPLELPLGRYPRADRNKCELDGMRPSSSVL